MDKHYTFRFYVVDRLDDFRRPKVSRTTWNLTLEDANRRVDKGEWLLAIPCPDGIWEHSALHHGPVPDHEGKNMVETLIQEGKVRHVKPRPDTQ